MGHIMKHDKLLAENPNTKTLPEPRLETLKDNQIDFYFEKIWKVIPNLTP